MPRAKAVHPESPLRLPLVRQLLSDPTVRLQARAIDSRWRDEGQIRVTVGGFNPFAGAVYYGRHSPLEGWLRAPERSARDFNNDDKLLMQLFFAVHDYIHVWATRLIQKLAPALGFGTRPVTRANVDDQLFGLLLTEAAATVGVDYWWLCNIELGEVLPVGTRITGGLTSPYHERHASEYRRFYPELDVQSPRFFADLCTFYCSGDFVGFGQEDLKRSPLLLRWMTKELLYGDKQREICRSWLAYLAHDDLTFTRAELAAPVDAEAPARRELIDAVGEALWRKVKHDEIQVLPARRARITKSPKHRRPDFRFCNANMVDDAARFAQPGLPPEEFEHLFAQAVSRCDFDAFDRDLIRLFPALLERRDPRVLGSVLRGQRLLPDGAADEPRDLLVLN